MTRREQERRWLVRHEEYMSRPVRELFPPQGPPMTSVCKQCGTTFVRSLFAGKSRGFCNERCRDAWCVAHGGKRRYRSATPRSPRLKAAP